MSYDIYLIPKRFEYDIDLAEEFAFAPQFSHPPDEAAAKLMKELRDTLVQLKQVRHHACTELPPRKF